MLATRWTLRRRLDFQEVTRRIVGFRDGRILVDTDHAVAYKTKTDQPIYFIQSQCLRKQMLRGVTEAVNAAGLGLCQPYYLSRRSSHELPIASLIIAARPDLAFLDGTFLVDPMGFDRFAELEELDTRHLNR
ncbi:hypothetical protein [Rhizobium sp. BE258]|uniref:hypothetical protein n=1 Tax=Rhizobium sp. BE258 TaxID=2817722 RepID=UPI0013AFA1F6|nr:hypothetical protein [Rhizobium sp. BE258]MDR7145008.1 hypothetical protein [Rhizobium sp. BE258]